MSVALQDLGPVSRAVEADLRTWVRRHGIVVWLDGDSHYTDLVEQLSRSRAAGDLPYEVFAFRGSHLELAFALEPLSGGVTKKSLVIHLPGFNEQDVRETPLLELYLAGARYRKALDTAVTEAAAGQVPPEEITAFLARGGLTLAAADAWLLGRVARAEGGVAAQLRSVSLPALLDDLLGGVGPVTTQLALEPALEPLWEGLRAMAGLPDSWREPLIAGVAKPAAPDVAFVVAAWALAVEYVDDVQRPPVDPRLQPARGLPAGVVGACCELARALRSRHRGFYQRTADETEALIHREVMEARAEDLGKIDTFRFEERKVLQAALDALENSDWNTAAAWADLRLNGDSFWLQENVDRDSAWRLIRAAAALGQAVVTAGVSLGARDLAAATARYTQAGAPVDRAHRNLEQLMTALLYPLLPEYERLRSRLHVMREVWRQWADGWARDFNALCRRDGFLPLPELQQRTLFDEVVRPLCQDHGPTAYFVVDALRYEMGVELLESMGTLSAANATLTARLAELPTVTEVGMNVLAPVAHDGRLRPSLKNGRIEGFVAAELRVSDPDSRRRAKHERVGGATCPWLTLGEVVDRDSASLKQAVARARLVVVWSQEIDQAGESGAGPAAFEKVLQKLVAAWRLLREAGVRRFVITADHGFLLLNDGAPVAQSYGRKVDPKRRHVFTGQGAEREHEAKVALADLRYDGVEQDLIFPDSTAVFDTGKRSMSFVHGGNSLQERVIPVLTIVHRAAAGASTVRYTVEAKACEGVADMHCLAGRVQVDAAQVALDFGASKEVELSLRALEAEGATVELCQVRGHAQLVRGCILATVGEEFEVFFRISGPTDARALVEVYHPSAADKVERCVVESRFAVRAIRGVSSAAAERAAASTLPGSSTAWLEKLPAGGPRQMFEHLLAHGVVTEDEANGILGSGRAARKFAVQFEAYAAVAPFRVRIQSVGGVKRYVREGTES
jgi:hypothetical protein